VPVHFLFDSVDLLEALASIEGEQGDDPDHPHWGMIKVQDTTLYLSYTSFSFSHTHLFFTRF
jgi:hypothetical protein